VLTLVESSELPKGLPRAKDAIVIGICRAREMGSEKSAMSGVGGRFVNVRSHGRWLVGTPRGLVVVGQRKHQVGVHLGEGTLQETNELFPTGCRSHESHDRMEVLLQRGVTDVLG
jgi:hypothetical protein